MDNVFVTGANGLLGTNVVLKLLEQGFPVTALVRKKSSFIQPDLEKLTLVEGDLLHTEQLIQAMKGCRYVVHIAANTSHNLLKLEDYYPSNVLGTENVVNACVQNQIEKLVYVGTANTYGYGSLSNPGHEGLPMKSPFTKSLYAQSKKQAQDIVDAAVSTLNITTISPTFMLGPYDTKPSSGKIILMALNRRFVVYPSGGKNFVHVSDVAQSIIKAFEIKQSGRKFIIANENLSYEDFYRKVISLTGQKTTLIPIPDFLLVCIGWIGDLSRWMRIKTDISSANMEILRVKNYYTSQKARQELNLDMTPIDQAIVDTIDYFKKTCL